jgi:hypothetical protein
MKTLRNEQGLAHVVVLLLIMAVVAAVAFAGYRVVKSDEADNASLSTASLTAVPKKIETKNDISKAIKALDATPIQSSVDPSQLNSDLNSLQ